MPKYNVRINLNSISYEIEADNEDKAVEFANNCASGETAYDLLKWADYETEVITDE
jgi:hypothetical protein